MKEGLSIGDEDYSMTLQKKHKTLMPSKAAIKINL